MSKFASAVVLAVTAFWVAILMTAIIIVAVGLSH